MGVIGNFGTTAVKNQTLNMKNIFALLTIFLSSFQLIAQEKDPKVTGKVIISIKDGTFDCDLTLSDIPQIKDYYIRLNSGMNILHFRSKKPNDFLIYANQSRLDSTSTGESLAYYFSGNEGKFLPESLQIKYVGKFPVVNDTIENYSRKDWKGNIAFNHNSLRTDGVQSAWYPILYDIEKDKTFEKVKYDIEIVCNDCNTIYVNGSLPVKGKIAHFKSEIPQELTLFSGNYEYSNIDETYILNSDFDKEQLKQFSSLINNYKKFYESKLNIPFEQATVFVSTTPTSIKDGWMFVSYPTIMSIGWQNGLKNLLEPKYQNFYRPFIAHELGHFYFGTFKVFNSELGDMMSEGFAEYLALQLTKNIIGKDVYDDMIKKKIENLKDFKEVVISFSKIKSQSEYLNRQLYVYNYAPLIFVAIEKEIGEKQMWKWLNNILKTEATYTNYDFLTSTLKSTLKNEKLFENIKHSYFESDKSIDNASNKITDK